MLAEYSLIIMGPLTKGYKKEENELDKGWNIFQGRETREKERKTSTNIWGRWSSSRRLKGTLVIWNCPQVARSLATNHLTTVYYHRLPAKFLWGFPIVGYIPFSNIQINWGSRPNKPKSLWAAPTHLSFLQIIC